MLCLHCMSSHSDIDQKQCFFSQKIPVCNQVVLRNEIHIQYKQFAFIVPASNEMCFYISKESTEEEREEEYFDNSQTFHSICVMYYLVIFICFPFHQDLKTFSPLT